MAEQEALGHLMLRLRDSMPKELFLPVNQMQVGMGAALQYLYEHREEPVSAGELSQFLHVSTPRVAALLRKLEGKGLIAKGKAPSDGRVTVICLSPLGVEHVEHRHRQMERRLGRVIDQIGLEKLEEYIRLGEQVRHCMGELPEVEE